MERKYILRAGSDKSFIYGILCISGDADEKAIQTQMYEARAKAMSSDKWSVEDAIDFLPESWNARVDNIATILV